MKTLLIGIFTLLSLSLFSQLAITGEAGHTLSNDFEQGIHAQIGVTETRMQYDGFGFYSSGRAGYFSIYDEGRQRYFNVELAAGMTNNETLFGGIVAGYANNFSREFGEKLNLAYIGVEAGLLVPIADYLFMLKVSPSVNTEREFFGRISGGVIYTLKTK